MAIIKANPEAEVSVGFSTVKAGTYRMRIKEVEDRNPDKNDLKVTLEWILPASELLGVDNAPLKGNSGNLFDYVSLDGSLDEKGKSKQWKLRTLTEAVGLSWSDYDPVVDLPGKELDVIVKLDTYEGEQKNKVSRYVIPK